MNLTSNPIVVSRTSPFPPGVAAESPSVVYSAAVAVDVIGSRSRCCYFYLLLLRLGHERKGLLMGLRNWREVSGFA